MSSHTAAVPARIPGGRLLGALPDVVTGIACIIVWISPFAFGQGAVKTVVLMMLMEFLLVHGTGFFTAVAFLDGASRGRRIAMMLGLLAFYAMFVGVFAWMFRAWWPLWVFAWLAIAKGVWIFSAPVGRGDEARRQMATWAVSVVAYLTAVFGGLLLPLPALGIGAEVVPTLGLPGGGEWVERPHIAVAGMAFYYFAIAAFKLWRGGGR